MWIVKNVVLTTVVLSIVVCGCDISDSRPEESYDRDRSDRELPSHASMIRESKGERMEFTPNRSGDYFIYEVSGRKVVKDGRLYDGQKLTVDPDKNRIYVDGKTVSSEDLKSNRTYRIYFARSDGRPYSDRNVADDRRNDDRDDWRDNRNPLNSAKLPKESEVVATGKGRVEFSPKHDGSFYVFDESESVVVKEGKISKGQMLIVDAKNDRIYIDKEVIYKQNLGKSSTYRIQFLRNR